MSAELIAHALGGRKSGNGRAAQCSAHDDHTASLSISEAHEGKVIVRCHAGCERDCGHAACGRSNARIGPGFCCVTWEFTGDRIWTASTVVRPPAS